jgi:ADP-ribosylglycohydrolase
MDPRWVGLACSVTPYVDLRDRFRGALVGGAIGDAMGRPNEGQPTDVARARKVREYQPWQGWTGGPKGTITDDTQMTMWLTESILANAEPAREQASRGAGVQGSIGETGNLGRGDEGAADLCDQLVDPDDLAQRFTRERIRGIGQTTRDFVRNYKDPREAVARGWSPVRRQRDGHASRSRRPRPLG